MGPGQVPCLGKRGQRKPLRRERKIVQKRVFVIESSRGIRGSGQVDYYGSIYTKVVTTPWSVLCKDDCMTNFNLYI